MFRLIIVILTFITCGHTFAQSLADAAADVDAKAEVSLFVDRSGATISGSSGTLNLFTSGVGSDSVSSAPTIYLPTGTSDNLEYSYYRGSSNGDILPVLESGSVPADVTANLTFSVDALANGTHIYLYSAYQTTEGDTENYTIIARQTTVDGVNSVSFSLTSVCSSGAVNCTSFDYTVSPSVADDTAYVVLFVDDDLRSTGDAVTSSDISSFGAYYKITFGNAINTFADVTLDTLEKGDSSLVASYTGTDITSDYKLFSRASVTSDSCPGESTDGSSTIGTIGIGVDDLVDQETTEQSGSVAIRNLENNTCYGTRLVFCDDFGFCSKVTREMRELPEEIDALLEQQGCFFFTAGFAGSHWVIRYLQGFRDNFLRSFSLGRSFVSFYYKYAPIYAPYILNKPLLQKLVRGIAYVSYAIIHYFAWWLTSLILMVAFLVYRRTGVGSYGRS